MGSQGPSPHNPKKRGVSLLLESQKTKKEDARPLPSRTCFAPEEIKQLRAGLARPGTKWDAWGCWAMRRPVEPQTDQLQELSTFTTPNVSARSSAITARELRGCNKRMDSRSLFPESPRSPPLSYLSLINSLVQPHKRTNVENRIRKRMAKVRELDTQIKEARTQQQTLLQDTRQLHREKLQFQAENTFFLEYLTHKTEELAKEPTKLWTEYIQESGAVKRRRQRLTPKYTKKLSVLKAELLQKRKAQARLKQQLQELKDVSLLKEKQDLQIQKLQEEQSRIEGQSATERHAQFLKEKALLEEQLNEPEARLLDKKQRKERQEKAQALRSAAKRSHLKFCQGVHMENQCLLKECRQLKQQSWKLEARQSWLEKQKWQLEQGQWLVQSLLHGRQQLHKRRSGCPQGQGAPTDCTKSKKSPQQFLQFLVGNASKFTL